MAAISTIGGIKCMKWKDCKNVLCIVAQNQAKII